LEDKFGDLYSALESAAKDKDTLIDVVKDQRWAEVLSDIAASKVEPPSYNVVGYLDLSCPSPNGVEVIKAAIIDARDSTKRNGTNVEFYYVGSPRYRVEITAPSYKVAESVMQKAVEEAIAAVKKAGGKGEFYRTGRR